MSEQAASAAPVTTSPPAQPRKNKSKNKKKWIKRIIAIVVILALVLGIGFGMWYLVFRPDGEQGKPLTDSSSIGSIQSVVEGYGNAMPKESAAITLSAAGTVEAVYVSVGDTVFAGDPLYTIDSQDARDKLAAAEKAVTEAEAGVADAQETVASAQKRLNELYEELAKIQEGVADLTITAPFAGKLQEVSAFEIDQNVNSGDTVAKLVNDKKLKIPLYFSYAYEDEIYVGQKVSVSIPAVMQNLTGTVETINKISYISPEGGVHFEAVIVIDNSGTLTEGMDASAAIATSNGTVIYPYEMGKTEFYESRTITTKARGPVVRIGTLLKYANVEAGEVLLTLGTDNIDEQVRSKNDEIAEAQNRLESAQESVVKAQENVEKALQEVEKAQEGLDNFDAVAPIDGVIFSCTLVEGENVKEGDTVITISNTTTMLVDIQVDSRNIGFIQAGMEMELTDDYGNPVIGTVTNVAMTGEVGSGVTTYPVQLAVDNFMGTIRNGSWLNYKLVTSESTDCVLVPNQCVKRVAAVDGEIYTVIFVQTKDRPDNAIDVDEAMLGDALPTPSEGFWPVPVTTGISDTYNVEIIEGLEPGVQVFTNREVQQSYGW